MGIGHPETGGTATEIVAGTCEDYQTIRCQVRQYSMENETENRKCASKAEGGG